MSIFLIQKDVQIDFITEVKSISPYMEISLENLSQISNKLDIFVPIGTIEFVHLFMKRSRLPIPKPINIPKALLHEHFLKRKIEYVHFPNTDYLEKYKISNSGNTYLFIKSVSEAKKLSKVIYNIKDFDNLPSDEYLISEFMEIDSEYRCFVHKDQLIDIRRYSGYMEKLPDFDIIHEMISTYHSSGTAPISYTLDVGITEKGTILIEVHDFYSIGTYGFSGQKLSTMFAQWFNNYRFFAPRNYDW